MRQAHYYVIDYRGRWMIAHERERFGPYPTQKAALRAATEAAQESARRGFAAKVLVEDINGQSRLAWADDEQAGQQPPFTPAQNVPSAPAP